MKDFVQVCSNIYPEWIRLQDNKVSSKLVFFEKIKICIIFNKLTNLTSLYSPWFQTGYGAPTSHPGEYFIFAS